MDTGRFESVSKPFSFHRTIRSSMVGLKMAADAKGVQFITEFDREIDLAARAAAYRERGKSEQWIAWQLGCNADEDAYVLGDEMRLIQVGYPLPAFHALLISVGLGGNQLDVERMQGLSNIPATRPFTHKPSVYATRPRKQRHSSNKASASSPNQYFIVWIYCGVNR